MYRNLLKTVVATWLLGTFLLVSGCMLLLGGAGGYFIAKGESGGDGGEAKSKTTTTSTNRASVYLETVGLGVKNERQNIASLGLTFGRFRLRRMRNASRHRGRYTESWEGIEANSVGIG